MKAISLVQPAIIVLIVVIVIIVILIIVFVIWQLTTSKHLLSTRASLV